MLEQFLKTGSEEHHIKEHREEIPFLIRNETRKLLLVYFHARYKQLGQAHGITAQELARRLGKARTTLFEQLEMLEEYGLLVSKRVANERLWLLNVYAAQWVQEVLNALSKHYRIQL